MRTGIYFFFFEKLDLVHWELDLITAFGHWEQSPFLSPQAFWSAGGLQKRLWRIRKKIKFFDWLSRNSLHWFTAEILR